MSAFRRPLRFSDVIWRFTKTHAAAFCFFCSVNVCIAKDATSAAVHTWESRGVSSQWSRPMSSHWSRRRGVSRPTANVVAIVEDHRRVETIQRSRDTKPQRLSAGDGDRHSGSEHEQTSGRKWEFETTIGSNCDDVRLSEARDTKLYSCQRRQRQASQSNAYYWDA